LKVCVTGATGFLGAHVTAALVAAGHDVRVTVRRRDRLDALAGMDAEVMDANVLDRRSMRRALRGCELLFHTAGLVASRPGREVWRVNAVAPRIAVELAAQEGLRRVVVTSSVGAIGPANGDRPADERQDYPQSGSGLLYPDAKHEGELAALSAGERLGVEVVAVNPAYILGAAHNRSLPGETSTRIVGNYLRGRLPAVVDSHASIVDVADVAQGHLLAATKGTAGERYILGGENLSWSEVIERVGRVSGVRNPVLVLPPEITRAAELLKRAGLPFTLLEGIRLMAPDWRYSSAKAKRELGYRPRGAGETIKRTVEWYMELIEDDRFPSPGSRTFGMMSGGVRLASRFGLLLPLKMAGQITRRRTVL
jgi:dihydroflavonol-4-reductase